MAATKLSPTERAHRKREAARLRQQRCRERKRQALKKKLLEEQKIGQSLSQEKCPPLPRLEQKDLHFEHSNKDQMIRSPVMCPFSPGPQRIISSCESFPSLGSEPSQSTDFSTEGSPRSIITQVSQRGPYAQKIIRMVSQTPSPPLPVIYDNISIHHLNRRQSNASRAMPELTLNQELDPNEIEMDAVLAMLSLKSSEAIGLPRGAASPSNKPAPWGEYQAYQGPSQRFYHCTNDYSLWDSHNLNLPEYAMRKQSITVRNENNRVPGNLCLYHEQY